MTKISIVVLAALGLSTAFAEPLKRAPSPLQEQRAIQHNNAMALEAGQKNKVTSDRPFSDLEPAGYLVFSSENDFNSRLAKETMARNLPSDVTLVVYSEPGDESRVRKVYEKWISGDRLKVVSLPDTGSGFWSRDGLPVPVWQNGGRLGVVDARYYHDFEPDQKVAGWFQSSLARHNYYYEGGNFMVTDDGTCLTVDNNRSRSIPLSVFESYYGCKRTIRLPFEKGIGHVDESVRVAGTNRVFTDSPTYASILKKEGFEVIALPRPENEYETYVNSLLVNGTMFVPVFNQAQDKAALKAYSDAGFKVVAINTTTLANDGWGSLHCITMTYPKVPFSQLLDFLKSH